MTPEQFEELLHRLENETIDFKREMYTFGGQREEQKEKKGDLKGKHSIRINDRYRIVFKFHNGDASEVEVTDYH